MLNIEVGKLYNVTMKSEPEFGGPMRVTKITETTVTAVFEFDGKQDPPALRFYRIGNCARPETLRYIPSARHRDAFPSGVVKFRPLTAKKTAAKKTAAKKTPAFVFKIAGKTINVTREPKLREYRGAAGPTEDQIFQNTAWLSRRLTEAGLTHKLVPDPSADFPQFMVVFRGMSMVYDRWGFVVTRIRDLELIHDQIGGRELKKWILARYRFA